MTRLPPINYCTPSVFFYFVTQILSRIDLNLTEQLLDLFFRRFIINFMTDIFFKQTDAEEAATVEELEKILFPKPWNLRDITESVKNPLHYSEIIEAGGEPVGYIIYSANRFEAELLRIGVIENFRNKGLAAALLRRMFKVLSEKGIHEVFLEVNENNPAVGFYNKNGFTEIARRKNYYGNENAIIMRAMVNNENNKS